MILRKSDLLAAAVALLMLLAFSPGLAIAGVPAIAAATPAATTATVPWEEFRALLKAEQALSAKTPEKTAPVYTIHSVQYRLQPTAASGGPLIGHVVLNGEWLAGEPEPLALFSDHIAITKVISIEGAHLVATANSGYQLLPEPGKFEAQLSIAIAATENGGTASRQDFEFLTPSALATQLVISNVGKRSISGENILALPNENEVEANASSNPDDNAAHDKRRYAYTGQRQLRLSISEPEAPRPLNVDIVNRISISAGRLQQTLVLSSDAPQSNIELQFDPSFAWQTNSRQGRLVAPGKLLLTELSARQPLQLNLERNWRPTTAGNNKLQLPSIKGNRGEQQLFALQNPLTGNLTANGNNLAAIAPAALKSIFDETQTVQKADSDTLELSFSAFQKVNQPALIVDQINYFASFADDGRHLATLQLTIPAGYGPRLSIPPVADAELWALAVNGRKQALYKNQAGDWVVPLQTKQASTVELTWMQQLSRPGLHGELALAIPPLGIASRQLNVALSLAPRLELLSLEGDLFPTKQRWAIPGNVQLNGNPRFFSVPFYRGKAINARLHYQEPVNGASAYDGGSNLGALIGSPANSAYPHVQAPAGHSESPREPVLANRRGWQMKP